MRAPRPPPVVREGMGERDRGRAPLAPWVQAQGFQSLMRQRVENILLVSSLYDSFILAEDGQLSEVILSQFLELNLSSTPRIMRVSSGAQAIELARNEPRHNLIITSMRLGDMTPLALARRVKDSGLDIPVVLLAYDGRELNDFIARNDVSDLERIFLWQGDVRILLAIVKYVEDRRNVAFDTGERGVQVILVVEDNIRWYSSFLPVIYTELMRQSHSLIPEGINLSHKLMRIQARPKILLSSTFEEAWRDFEAYGENVLGILSDVEFPRDGELHRTAGVEFACQVRAAQPDIPIALQSSQKQNKKLARDAGAAFLPKGSPTYLAALRRFMQRNFGFGDFIFRLAAGAEVSRAHDLKQLEEQLKTVPAESVLYHAERNHFSKWLKARTEFALAFKLRPRKVSEFPTPELLREDLIRSIQEHRQELKEGIVADFDAATFDDSDTFSRIGHGSLGGKARGLAFVNRLLTEQRVRARFTGVRITVPSSVVLTTDAFDAFLETNHLRDFAIKSDNDEELIARFLAGEFPEPYRSDLLAFAQRVRYPIAVRSSSLLEDSQYQPFAGVYATFMLPNAHPDVAIRHARILDAVKRVFASTFSSQAKVYLATTPYRLEEEKMAIILQKVVGRQHGARFYPDFAGVGRSYNFYPTPPMTTEDGIAAVALGLGKTVVDGNACVRFCPRYPRHVVQFSAVKDILQSSQREFVALEISDESEDPAYYPPSELKRYALDVAEEDGTLTSLGSTYSHENAAVYDGLSRAGVRLVTFAPILKHDYFPLAEIVDTLLRVGAEGTSTPVEIEFAACLSADRCVPSEFGFLQLRPLALSREMEEVDLGSEPHERTLCRSSSVLGHGCIQDLRDAIVVDYHRYERGRSREVAMDVARMNVRLASKHRPYLLIGVGRWGSADPFLGIPVSWDQISAARVIIESGFRDFRVTPSQGTHFFQNLTALNIGYFTVNPHEADSFVDWSWLADQPAEEESGWVRHLRFDAPLIVKMDGKRNAGVILKP